jgi:hypothetical protein
MPYAGPGVTKRDRKWRRDFEAALAKLNAIKAAKEARGEADQLDPDHFFDESVRKIMETVGCAWDDSATGWDGNSGSSDPVDEPTEPEEWKETPLLEEREELDIVKGWPWKEDPSRSITVVCHSLMFFDSLSFILSDAVELISKHPLKAPHIGPGLPV